MSIFSNLVEIDSNFHSNELVQERCNFVANTLEYVFLALTHHYTLVSDVLFISHYIKLLSCLYHIISNHVIMSQWWAVTTASVTYVTVRGISDFVEVLLISFKLQSYMTCVTTSFNHNIYLKTCFFMLVTVPRQQWVNSYVCPVHVTEDTVVLTEAIDLTQLPLVWHIFVRKLSQHWFR